MDAGVVSGARGQRLAARRTARRPRAAAAPARRSRAAPPACATDAAPSGRARAPARRAPAQASASSPERSQLAHQRFASPAPPRSRSAPRSARRAARAADPRRTPATRGAARRRAGRLRRRKGSISVARLVARHRVDREVAAREVLLERHVGRDEELEAAVAAAVLALGARQRVFLARLRMQEHRENRGRPAGSPTRSAFPASPPRRPSRDRRRAAEQFVAHRAADAIDLHRLRIAGAVHHPRTLAAGRRRAQSPASRGDDQRPPRSR